MSELGFGDWGVDGLEGGDPGVGSLCLGGGPRGLLGRGEIGSFVTARVRGVLSLGTILGPGPGGGPAAAASGSLVWCGSGVHGFFAGGVLVVAMGGWAS